MDRKVDAIGIQPLGEEKFRIVEMGVKSGQIAFANFYTIDCLQDPVRWKNLINQYCGRISMVFPMSKTYLCEIEISSDASEKDKNSIFASYAETALPSSVGECFVFQSLLQEEKNKRKYLVFFLPKNAVWLKDEVEKQKISINPGAVYNGFSCIQERMNMENLVLVQKKQEVEIYWGKNGILEGVRCLKMINLSGIKMFLRQILDQRPSMKEIYAFCESNDELRLKEALMHLNLEWKKTNFLAANATGQNQKDDEYLMYSTFAHVVNEKSLFEKISMNRGRFFSDSSLKKSIKKAILILFCVGLLMEIGILKESMQVKNARGELDLKFQKSFREIFSSQTPMIDPVKQLNQKLMEKREEENVGLKPARFVEIIHILHQTKNDSIHIDKIVQKNRKIVIDAIGPSKEAISQWIKELDQDMFEEVKVNEIEEESKGDSFKFQMEIIIR